MILGRISELSAQTGIAPQLLAIIKQALSMHPETLSAGHHAIDGDDIFMNIMSFDTSEPQIKRYEQHREYLDIQVLLSGQERIDFGPIGAAIGAVAGQILKKPLGQMAAKTYRVTGPWSDPHVETIDKNGKRK